MASRMASRTVRLLNDVPAGTSCSTTCTATGACADALIGVAGVCAAALAAGAAVWAGEAASDRLSPSSSKTAMAELTATLAVPSAINSLPIIPSSTASNSIVALSVSISARISPELTLSPSATSHLARVPSSIVGDSAGIKISIAMG